MIPPLPYPLAHVADWARTAMPHVGRDWLAGGAVVAGWLGTRFLGDLLAWVARALPLAAGVWLALHFLRG
jgi:hypothetical protein